MTRRTWAITALTIGVVALSACAPATSDDADGDGDAGGRLVVARTGDIDNLDPHMATAFQTVQTLELVYDSLFELNPDLEAVPALAEDYSYDDAGTELTITLRDGVTFHDGSTLDSADVTASIERILDEEVAAVTRANLLSISEVTASDDRTVVLTLSEPDGTLPFALAGTNASILSADAIAEDTIGSAPMGTGPFAFGNWDQGQSVSLTAHDDHWGDGPYVDDVQFRVIPDEASLHAGMQAGEFHIGVMTDPAVVTQINEDQLTVERTPALAYRTLMLNTTVEPLGDVAVRQAIACAIDREQLVDSATFGEGAVTGPFTAPAFAGDPYDGLPCDGPDVELARDLLDSAGVADGFELETIVITGEYGTAIAEAQNLQAQLAEINVDLDLVQLETNIYVERWLDTDFDAAVALNGGRPDPHQMYARYFTSTGNLNGVATYSSETLDTLFADGLAETDEQARADIYAEISQELLDASPWAWLFTGFEYRVLQPEVSGFVPTATGSLKTLRTVELG
jgi:peptide/nickel transport system substrate-binding protein